MSNRKRYFVREDTKLRLKAEYKEKLERGELTEDDLYKNRNSYYEQYRDFSVDSHNNSGIMYTVKSGFSSFDDAKSYVKELRGE